MSDDFLFLFGGVLLNDEEEADAPGLRSASSDGTVVAARVLANLGAGTLKVELPDGRSALVEQSVFENVRPGSHIPVFRDSQGVVAVVADPKHPDMGRCFPAIHLGRGDEVVFVVESHCPERDVLTGHCGGVAAVASRANLEWPLRFADLDPNELVGRSLSMLVADPLATPLELACTDFLKKSPRRVSTSQLLALRALAKLKPDVELQVVRREPNILLEFLGLTLAVFPEDYGWRRTPADIRVGGKVSTSFSVDMATADVILCLRRNTDPEWNIVKERYPVGTIIGRGELISYTYRTMTVRIDDDELNIVALLPISIYMPSRPFNYYGSYKIHEVPFPLEVIGYHEDRCMLLLGISPLLAERWERRPLRIGSVISVGQWCMPSRTPLVLWDIGCTAETTDVFPDGYSWAQVKEYDPVRRHLLLKGLGTSRSGVICDSLWPESEHIRFDDGSEAELRSTSLHFPPGTAMNTILQTAVFTEHGCRAVVTGDPQSEAINILYEELKILHDESHTVGGVVRHRVQQGWLVGTDYTPSSSAASSQTVISAFLPDSQAVPGLAIGDAIDLLIVKLERTPLNIIVSQRSADWKQDKKRIAEAVSRLEVGMTVGGTVKRVIDYGVIVNLGEVDGLLHKKRISHARTPHPIDWPRVGEYLTVVVLRTDAASCRVDLGLKQLMADPWDTLAERCRVGEVHRATVENIVDYGAFLSLEEGVTGLLHNSDLDWRDDVAKYGSASDYLERGKRYPVRIDNINLEKKRISFSRKALIGDPFVFVRHNFRPGAEISGRVRNVKLYGLFVEIFHHIDGLVHVSHMPVVMLESSNTLMVGQAVRVRVLDVDEASRRVSLELIRKLPDIHIIADVITGTLLEGRLVDGDGTRLIVEIDSLQAHGTMDRRVIEEWRGPHYPLEIGTRVLVEVLDIEPNEIGWPMRLCALLDPPLVGGEPSHVEGVTPSTADHATEMSFDATTINRWKKFPTEAIGLAKKGVLTSDQIPMSVKKHWLAEAKPHDVAGLIARSLLKLNNVDEAELKECRQRWIRSANPTIAAQLKALDVISAEDFREPEASERRRLWIRQANDAEMTAMVRCGVAQAEEFLETREEGAMVQRFELDERATSPSDRLPEKRREEYQAAQRFGKDAMAGAGERTAGGHPSGMDGLRARLMNDGVATSDEDDEYYLAGETDASSNTEERFPVGESPAPSRFDPNRYVETSGRATERGKGEAWDVTYPTLREQLRKRGVAPPDDDLADSDDERSFEAAGGEPPPRPAATDPTSVSERAVGRHEGNMSPAPAASTFGVGRPSLTRRPEMPSDKNPVNEPAPDDKKPAQPKRDDVHMDKSMHIKPGYHSQEALELYIKLQNNLKEISISDAYAKSALTSITTSSKILDDLSAKIGAIIPSPRGIHRNLAVGVIGSCGRLEMRPSSDIEFCVYFAGSANDEIVTEAVHLWNRLAEAIRADEDIRYRHELQEKILAGTAKCLTLEDARRSLKEDGFRPVVSLESLRTGNWQDLKNRYFQLLTEARPIFNPELLRNARTEMLFRNTDPEKIETIDKTNSHTKVFVGNFEKAIRAKSFSVILKLSVIGDISTSFLSDAKPSDLKRPDQFKRFIFRVVNVICLRLATFKMLMESRERNHTETGGDIPGRVSLVLTDPGILKMSEFSAWYARRTLRHNGTVEIIRRVMADHFQMIDLIKTIGEYVDSGDRYDDIYQLHEDQIKMIAANFANLLDKLKDEFSFISDIPSWILSSDLLREIF